MKQTQMETMIKIEGLKKKFGEFTAVDGLNFDIFKNEVFGLLGPNGAGKTTTIKHDLWVIAIFRRENYFWQSSRERP